MMKTIAIIGGGAAGLMCATQLQATSGKLQVFLFEKNPHLGAKVIISGGGRCNVTTGFYRKAELQSKYIRGRDLIKHAIAEFGPRQIYKWFEEHGVPLKIEKDMRVFPVSDNGKDIVRVFEEMFDGPSRLVGNEATQRVDVKLGCHVASIQKESIEIPGQARDDGQGGFTITTKSGEIFHVDNVVLTTGGNAYRHTGSTGDGYAFAQSLGHSITTLGPSLSSFQTNNEWLHGCTGLAFEHARLTWDGGSSQGPVLLTHFGISGPTTFVASAYLAFETIDQQNHIALKLAPKADMNYEKWREFLTKSAHEQPNKQLDTILGFHFPDRFVKALLDNLTLEPHTKMSQLSKEDKKIIAHELGDGISLTIISRRPGDEFVTAGGIPANEINPKTLESLICPGLYFAGEIMDVDGVTGGYNLTSSWATGKLVADSIIQKSQ